MFTNSLEAWLVRRLSARIAPELTVVARRIRRQVHSRGNADWYATVDDTQREKLRGLGRRLMSLVADYVAKRGKKSSLLEEARTTGAQYGEELAGAGMSLSQAVNAFTFFRRSLDQSAKQALSKQGTPPSEAVAVCEQIMALADEVLYLVDGQVMAHGTHDDLMSSSAAYCELMQAFEHERDGQRDGQRDGASS